MKAAVCGGEREATNGVSKEVADEGLSWVSNSERAEAIGECAYATINPNFL